MASNALPIPDNSTRPHTPGSTHSPNISPTVVVRRLSRQGSRGGGGKVLSAVLQFEQVIAAQQPTEKSQRTFSLSKGASLSTLGTGRGSSASPVLARSNSSDVSLPPPPSPSAAATSLQNLVTLSPSPATSLLAFNPLSPSPATSLLAFNLASCGSICVEEMGAQATAASQDCVVAVQGVQSGEEGEGLTTTHPSTAGPNKDQLSIPRGPQATNSSRATSSPQATNSPQATSSSQATYGPQATRYMVRLGDREAQAFARRRSDTEPLIMDATEEVGGGGGGGNTSSDDSESSVDLLSSPSKDSNRGSKEIGEDDGLDKRCDVDKKLAFWVYGDFVPACHALLTNCTLAQVDAHRVLCDLRNVSNVISFFCDEYQRSSLLPSSPGQQRNSLTLSRLEQPSKPVAGVGRPSSPGQVPNDTPPPPQENVVIKVLRSASYGLMGPLLTLAQSPGEFNTDLLKQIVEALQKISWKVEACLSYSNPDQDCHVHKDVFDAHHVGGRVRDMMIKAQPPEEGKLAPAVKGSHGRSNSVAVHHRPSSGKRRSGEQTARPHSTKSTSLDDGDHSPSSCPISPTRLGELQAPPPHEGEEPVPLVPLQPDPAVPLCTEQTRGLGEGLGEEAYFRPRVYRRTTVSLSRNEVDHLGLNAAKIGEWEGQGAVQQEKFYQVMGRNLNQMKRSTECVSEEGGEKEMEEQRKHLSVSSSFEEVLMPQEGDFPSPLPRLTTPPTDQSAPTTPRSPNGVFSYVKPPSAAVEQAPIPRRPVKKTKSDLSRKLSAPQKEIQRVKSEKTMSVEMRQSLLLHSETLPKGGGVVKGGAGEKGRGSTLSKLISKKHRSFGHSDRKNKRRDDVSGSPDTVDQDGLFFESIENFSKEVHSSPPAGEEQLGVTVELATPKQGKSPRKKSFGSAWFEITVTTNMILQFGRGNYVILRQLKAFQKLYDSLTKTIPGSVHQLPEMPDKRGSVISDKRNATKRLEALLRYIATNGELRATSAFKEFLTPDDLFGSASESGSEVNFELLMTFYTPDEHVEASHSLVIISGEHSRPVTPTALQNPRPSTMKRGSLHLMQRDGKEDPSTLIIREEGRDALIVSCEDERYVVVAGTFEKLVEQLACEEKPDSRFVTTFILGYRHVASGMDLLTHLTRRFRMKLAPNATEEEIAYTEKWKDLIQLRVLDVITFWVKKCWPDFCRNAELLEKTREFIVSLKSSDDVNFKHAAEKMESLIADKMLAMHTATPTATPPCLTTSSVARPISVAMATVMGTSPRHHTAGPTVDVNTISALQLARELTLIELDFLKALDMHELAVFTWESNNAVNKPFRRNLDAYIARFNEVSFWVATEVLSVPDPKGRGMLIEKFVDVAKHCLDQRNYNTTISVALGLSLSAVRRLKRSWECVSEKSSKSFQKLYQLTSPSNNHTEYRRALASSISKKDNYIPYFGVFMRDLTFFNEGNPKHLSNGLINFSKLRALVLKFEEIKKSQGSKYLFPSEDKIKDYCIRLAYLSESDLYDKSEMLEPREVPFEHPETTDV